MATDNGKNDGEEGKTPDPKDKTQNTDDDNGKQEPTLEERLEALVEARLKPIKDKLDGAYSQRDSEKARADALEKEKREAELKRLEDEGKHKEAAELKVAEAQRQADEERRRREAAEEENTKLTRDLDVKNALSGHNFRNDKAAGTAHREIVDELVKNSQGVWVHKSGASIKDCVEAFVKDDANSYLFKARASSGSGSDTAVPSKDTSKGGSLFAMSQAEVLEMAAKGKLPKRK
jgi:hypothetical protein